MAELEERVATLEMRVEKMDMDLKEHFAVQQLFISSAIASAEKHVIFEVDKKFGARIAGVEQTLGGRIDGVEQTLGARIDKMDAELKHHFTEFRTIVAEAVDGVEKRLGAGFDARLKGIDARLNVNDARFDGIDARLNGIDAKLVGVDRKLDILLSRMPPPASP